MTNILNALKGSKTYIFGTLSILTGLGGWHWGYLPTGSDLELISIGLGLMGVRAAISGAVVAILDMIMAQQPITPTPVDPVVPPVVNPNSTYASPNQIVITSDSPITIKQNGQTV